MAPARASVLVRRRRAAVAAVSACGLLAVIALLLTGGDGPSRADLGDQTDQGSVGAAVDSALRDRAPGARSAESSATCAAQTRDSYGQGLGPLVYAATLRWQGVPAVALAYQVAGARPANLDHRVFVVSAASCELLVVQSL